MRTSFVSFLKPRPKDRLYGHKLRHANSIGEAKNELRFSELCEFADKTAGRNQGINNMLFGNAIPKTYDHLGKLPSKTIVFQAESLESQINWILLAIRKHNTKILLFNEYRSEFEHSFLLGDYESAEKWLNKIEQDVCHSIWSLGNRMLLLEFKESPEANKSFLSDLNKSAKGFFVPYFAHFMSNRCERGLSVSRYDSDLQNTLQKLTGPVAEENRQFYYLNCNKFFFNNYDRPAYILNLEEYNSVIDRYLSLVNVLKLLYTSTTIESKTRDFVNSRIKYLIRKFDEPDLRTAYHLEHLDCDKELADNGIDQKVLDLFTSGLYDECISSIKKKLKEVPGDFQYYVLYAKCFHYGQLQFKLPSNVNCVQNSLINEVYLQQGKLIDPYESLTNIQRTLKNLSSFRIANGIHLFVNAEFTANYYWRKFDILSLSYNNPEIAAIIDDKQLAKEYLRSLKRNSQGSLTLDFYLKRFEPDFDKQIDALNMPSLIKDIELAKYFQNKESYSDAAPYWEKALAESGVVTPLYEVCLRNLFNTYVKLGQFDEAINIYVNNVLKNGFLGYGIDVAEIQSLIRKSKFKCISATINSALFYALSNADENEQHIAYERFNESIGVKKPSDLLIKADDPDLAKWIAFLNHCCTSEIFKHSLYINGSKERYSERIFVCRTLSLLDPSNEELYKGEINTLTDALIIQEGQQQLDESKIYVNEQGLIGSELKEFEGLFNRYKTIANILRESGVCVIIDKKRRVRVSSLNKSVDNLTEEYSSDPLRDAFEDVFDVVTRKFLFSKFGISAYLSTRIRHGVLLGEIRPIFEKFNLISQKSSADNKYKQIIYWNERYSFLDERQKSNIQKVFAEFSEQIDKIIQDLIKNNLQIKTEDENLLGWFDYFFSNNILALHAVQCMKAKDYTEFVKLLLEILWLRTDENLESIRNKIQTGVKAQFNEAIEKLSVELQEYIHKGVVAEIHTNITTCLTEIQTVLDRIASWFNRSGSQIADFKLDKLIAIVIDNVNHSYPKRKLQPNEFVVPEIILKGEFYTHFADLFRIFFDNALKHSDQTKTVIPCGIFISRTDNELLITIENYFSSSDSVHEITKQNKGIDIKKLSTEGKSGIPKAVKILGSDLKSETNSYNVRYDDGKFIVNLNIALEKLIV